MISFEYPLVLFIPIIIYICQKYCKKSAEVIYLPNAKYYVNTNAKMFNILNILKWFTILFIIISLSSPYTKVRNPDTRYGINILIGLDVSGSMDLIFDDVKASALNFTKERSKDNIGLILFAQNIMLASPMTTQTKYIENILSNLKLGMINAGGTAIYDTLVTANKILEKQEGFTKIIIIFTDGEDTTSHYSQEEVTRLFNENQYRIYSLVDGPRNDFLYSLSNTTNGKYFDIKDVKKLSDVYNDISDLEKELVDSDIVILKNYQYIYFSWFSFITLLFYILVRYKVLKR